MQSKEIPVIRPAAALVIEFEAEEKKAYKVEVTWKSPSGKDVLARTANDVIIGGDQKNKAGLIININNLKLEEEGEYTVDIFIDGDKVGNLPFSFEIVK